MFVFNYVLDIGYVVAIGNIERFWKALIIVTEYYVIV